MYVITTEGMNAKGIADFVQRTTGVGVRRNELFHTGFLQWLPLIVTDSLLIFNLRFLLWRCHGR
jgi:hypothetical protein